jgi:hypothetical protein
MGGSVVVLDNVGEMLCREARARRQTLEPSHLINLVVRLYALLGFGNLSFVE